jgi:hypothetical protein
MAREIVRVGLDAQGKVVERLEDAVMVIETEFDEEGKLVRETFYEAEGKVNYRRELPLVSNGSLD